MQTSYVEPPVRPLLPEQLSFLAILNFVLRNLPLMLVLGVIASTLLVVQAVRSPVMYASTSIFSTGEEAAGNRILAFLGGGTSFSNAGSQYYIDLMGAPVILEPLSKVKFDFPTGKQTALQYYAGTVQPPDRALESVMGDLSKRISAKVKDPSGWIELTTKGDTPVLAQELNHAVLAQIDSFNAEKRRKRSLEDRVFAEERLADLGAQVRNAENRLQAFRERNRDLSPPGLALEHERLIDSVSTRRSLYSAILQSYDRERLDAQRQSKVITMIARPNLPYAPIPHGVGRTVVLGLFAGAFLGAVIGIIREYFQRIRKQASPEYEEYRALLSRWFRWVRLPRRKAAA